MQAEEVAMFLTSNPHLLNRTETRAWRQAGIRPLRRSIPVRGINKTAEGKKPTPLAVWRVGGGGIKGCYMDGNGLYLRLSSNWSIHLPSHLWHHSYCLWKTPALCKFCLWLSSTLTSSSTSAWLTCVSPTVERVYLKGYEVTDLSKFLPYLRYSRTPLTSSSPLWASTCFSAQLDKSQQQRIFACHCDHCLEAG